MLVISSRLRRLCAVAVLVSVATAAQAIKPGDHVNNFKLPDENGNQHELYKLQDKKAIVFMTQGNSCPIVRLAVPVFREIRDRYQARGVEFFLLNPNLQDTPATVKAESKEYEFNIPIWLDHNQKVGEALGVDRTAEVFVVDPKTWTLMYHGPIDDSLSYEKQHPAQHHYLIDALDSVLDGKPVKVASAMSPGCLINFAHRSPVR